MITALQLINSADSTKNKLFQTISLASGDVKHDIDDNDCDSKPFGDAALSLKASIGETAVDFAFAPPLPFPGTESSGPENSIFHLFPVFVLHGNGNVFCLLTG
jgi:hypothetical protein